MQVERRTPGDSGDSAVAPGTQRTQEEKTQKKEKKAGRIRVEREKKCEVTLQVWDTPLPHIASEKDFLGGNNKMGRKATPTVALHLGFCWRLVRSSIKWLKRERQELIIRRQPRGKCFLIPMKVGLRERKRTRSREGLSLQF